MRSRIKYVALGMLVLTLNSCALFLGKEVETRIYTITEIKSDALYGGGQEGINAGGVVVQNETEWNALRDQMNTINPAVGEIDLDFETKTVLVYFDEIRGTGGYTASILSATENEGVLEVECKVQPPTEMATDVITQPFTIVSIGKTDKPVKFSVIE